MLEAQTMIAATDQHRTASSPSQTDRRSRKLGFEAERRIGDRRVRRLSVLEDRRSPHMVAAKRRSLGVEPTRWLALQNLHSEKDIVAPEGNRRRAYLLFKRLFDLVGATLLLVAFSPIMVAVLLLLTITTKGRRSSCKSGSAIAAGRSPC